MSTQPSSPFSHTDEFEDPRGRIRLCQFALGLGAIALGLQAAVLTLDVIIWFGDDKSLQPLRELVQSRGWEWAVGTPLTWGAALASWLLVGRFRERSGNVLALALAIMNTFDVALWLHSHAGELSITFAVPYMHDEWVRRAVGIFQWFELWIFVTLATRVGNELGRREVFDVSRAARATAMVGLAVWSFAFFSFTSLKFGWTRRADRRFLIEMYLLLEFANALLALTAFQATVVLAQVCRACRGHLKHLKRVYDEDELLSPRSDEFDNRRDQDPWQGK
jgi:hypothetical protein